MDITLTGTTCGEMCWRAAEQVCRCSCGGRNHGIALRMGQGQAEQPVRTRKIDGIMYRLASVGTYADMHRNADHLNRNAPNNTRRYYGYTAFLMSGDKGAFARVKPATESEVARWPELADYRGQRRRPYLLWTRVDD